MKRDVEFSDVRETIRALADVNEWHHHYLPPECSFNDTSKHKIVLEVDNAKAMHCTFDEKPAEELEWLENEFFGE